MDPLSSVVSLLRPRNYLSAGFEAGGDWAVHFPAQPNGIKTGAIAAGNCWLMVEGESHPHHLFAGDCFLLPRGRAFRLANDLGTAPVNADQVFKALPDSGITVLNAPTDFSIISNRFVLTQDYATLLERLLPAVVIVRAAQNHGTLSEDIRQMLVELRNRLPGTDLIIEHLAQKMLVQTLRAFLLQGASETGWLFALADRQISTALNQMHDHPARRWTVEELATICGMSRSGFAARFKTLVGVAPLSYLTHWRMTLAGDRLRRTTDPISTIALAVGYESEAAFSTAFKKTMGYAPRDYAKRAATLAASEGGTEAAAPGATSAFAAHSENGLLPGPRCRD